LGAGRHSGPGGRSGSGLRGPGSRVVVPGECQVPARVVPALRRLPESVRHSPRRHRGAAGRGILGGQTWLRKLGGP
jgi:hypothetical protein